MLHRMCFLMPSVTRRCSKALYPFQGLKTLSWSTATHTRLHVPVFLSYVVVSVHESYLCLLSLTFDPHSCFPSINFLEGIDPVLEEFKCRKEDGIDGGRSSHRHPKAAIHVPSEELDLRYWYFLSFRVHESVSLVYALDGIDGI